MTLTEATTTTPSKRSVICDIETDSLDATKIWCIVCIDTKTEEVRTFKPDEIEVFKEYAKTVDEWIGHNFLGFDVYHLNRLANASIRVSQITDTLIMSRLLDPGMHGGHSLEAWGVRLGYPKTKYEDFSQYTEEMLKYCINDTKLCLKLYRHLKYELRFFSLQSLKLEHEVQYLLDKSKRHGFYLNADKAKALRLECLKESAYIEYMLYDLFPPEYKAYEVAYQPKFNKDGEMSAVSQKKIASADRSERNPDGTYVLYNLESLNLGSPKQLVERLDKIGWSPYIFTKGGKAKICEENLATSKRDGAKQLSKWLTLNSRVKVIANWLDYYNPQTRRVHGTIIGLGASTHRMAHRDPQMGNIPAVRSLKGEAMRECWGIEDATNYCMVGTDIAGIQLRILAHLMDNPSYTHAIASGTKDNGDDVHTVNRDILRLVSPQVSRDVAKTFIYAMLLGAGYAKLGQILGMGADAGRLAKDKLFEHIPGFKKVEAYCKACADRGYMVAIDGRRITVPSAHYCLAIYLQANEAIIMKRALVLMNNTCKHLDWHQLTVVHDEIQSEVRRDQAKELGELQVKAIEEAGRIYNLRCPLTGEFRIGNNWKETH